MATPARLGPPGRVVLLVSAVVLFGHAWSKYRPYTWLDGDGRFYVNITKGLVRNGSLDQRGLHPTSWYERSLGWNRNLGIAWSNVSQGRTGTYYPKHSYVMPVLLVPFWLVLQEPGTLVYNVLAILATVWLMFLLAREAANELAAAGATLALVGGSIFVPSAYHLLADFTHAAFALAALWSGWRGRWGWTGLMLGMAIWARPVNVVLLPAACLLLGLRWPGRREALRFAAMLAVPLAIFAALNTWMFGAPWVTSYQRVLIMKNGQPALGDHADLYTVPLLDGLVRIFATRGDGLVRAMPVVGLAVLGLPWLLARHRRLGAVVLVAMVANVLSTAKFSVYHSRYFVVFVALSAVPLACLVDRVIALRSEASTPFWTRRRALVAAAIVLALLSGAAVATRWPRRPGDATGPTLWERAEQMRVTRGETPCDFWNGQHAAFECIGAESRDAGNLTGRVPSHEREVAGWNAMRALWVVPSARTRPLVVRFPTTRPGPRGFVVVAAATAGATGLPFEVEVALDDARTTITIERAGQRVRRRLRPHRVAELVLTIRAPRGGRARGLVLDGWPY